jgi:cell wall-associated NlpC family hydrolase
LNPSKPKSFEKSFYILSLIALFASCKSSSLITSSSAENNKESANQIITEIVNTASENIGVQYKTAGTTKAGYDCSGLVLLFGHYNVKLPAHPMNNQNRIQLDQNLKKADRDLIFFKTNRRSKINHVGIVTEVLDNDIKFIHASTSKGLLSLL